MPFATPVVMMIDIDMKLHFCLFCVLWANACFAIDETLSGADVSNTVSEVYRGMVVVQRKAKAKAGHTLLSIVDANEYSVSPGAVNSVDFGLGYAFSDSFEMYANVAAIFYAQDVGTLQLENGQTAQWVTAIPKFHYGVEMLWLPAYGKDSWGLHTIVRSDTFFKLAVDRVQFSASSGGWREAIGVGKTFFLSRLLNPRIAVSFGIQDSIVNGAKSTLRIGLIELGGVWYL